MILSFFLLTRTRVYIFFFFSKRYSVCQHLIKDCLTRFAILQIKVQLYTADHQWSIETVSLQVSCETLAKKKLVISTKLQLQYPALSKTRIACRKYCVLISSDFLQFHRVTGVYITNHLVIYLARKNARNAPILPLVKRMIMHTSIRNRKAV